MINNHTAQCSTTEINSPTRTFRLIPAGMFRANDGRPNNIEGWVLNKAAALKIIQAAQQRATDFVIDYEHQTLQSKNNGNPAPAAGWFKKLEWREGDGLYVVDARWTDIAGRMILAKEYRYISPVFTYDKSGNVQGIHSAALTNTPALDGLTELIAARSLDNGVQAARQFARNISEVANLIACKATAYQKEQAAIGIYVSTAQAVDHVSRIRA